MLPWEIEIVKEKEVPVREKQIPLYLPLEYPRLTGSTEQIKEKEKKGSVDIDYSL
tara:strand:- start:214 stop:378 length:165 start_codon:yes stop_codon:yes gene_type:complete